jgi:CarD family transcriptional regulator
MAVKYSVNDRVVYPGYGVARIACVVKKAVGVDTIDFFELKFLNKDMTVLVPTTKLTSVGIRPLSPMAQVTTVFQILSQPAREISPYELTASNWNKRNKDYQSKIRRGDLIELSEIYRDLKHISQQKELSFGEKNLLQQTETLLAEEISLIEQVEEEMAVTQLRASFISPRMTMKVQTL